MLLKKLELLGFKSFAQKTTLEFPSGVTAVVGPNGSGKSNLTDAIRWVLGETSSKSIRADRAQNLIFGGTPQRARAGFAQVTMTLDNSTGFFPIDFSEVIIRRRVGQDSTSHYYLNDSEVRLRDIVDFFAKARMGTKGFAIINQGSSDMFIKASPQERRMMLEEVLGLRQYQIKRHEAQIKLENTRNNLDEARGRTEELLPHLRLLRRQSAKWEKHDTLRAELNELENQYFGSKLRELETELAQITPQINELEEKIAQENTALHEREARLKEVEASQPKNNTHYDEFHSKQQELLERRGKLQRDLGRLEAEIDFISRSPKSSIKEAQLLELVSDTTNIISEIEASEDVQHIQSRLKELKGKIEKVLSGDSQEKADKKIDLEKSVSDFTKELENLEKEISGLKNQETQLTDALRAFNDQFKSAYEEVEIKRKEVSALENQKSKLNFEEERIGLKRADLEHQARQIGRQLSEFRKESQGPFSGGSDISDTEKKMFRARGELAAIGEIDPAMIQEAKDMEERYAFLEGQINDLESAAKDLEKLIQDLIEKIHNEFELALKKVNKELEEHFKVMFNGGRAKLVMVQPSPVILSEAKDLGPDSSPMAQNDGEENTATEGGLEIEISIPRKNIKGLDMLSGGERSLVSIAVLFALITVSPPPFLVLDEIDAALDENNTKRFSNLVQSFSKHSQFIIVTHNRATMSAANVLYGVTMNADGTSRLLSIKLAQAEELVAKP